MIGAALGAMVAVAIGLSDSIAVVSVAVIFGFLAIAIRKLMIIISTSYFGASLLVGGIDPVQSVIAVFIAAVGVACQYTMTSGKGKPKDTADISSASDGRGKENDSSASMNDIDERQKPSVNKTSGIS